MSQVLLTGGHGFLGSRLAKTLASQDHTVHLLPHDYLVEKVDLLEDKVRIINPEYIFHLAAFGNMSWQKDEFDIFNANLAGTFNLLQASRDVKYKAFVNVSTSSVTLEHQTLYSATKLGAEYLCHAYVNEFDKPIVTIRPFSVYGENEDSRRFIPTVFRSCLQQEAMTLDPVPYHDWIYIDDVVKFMILSAQEINEVRGKALNAGTGITTSNFNIVRMIENITGKIANITAQKRIRTFDTRTWKAQPAILHTTPLEQGLQKVYDSIRQSTENN